MAAAMSWITKIRKPGEPKRNIRDEMIPFECDNVEQTVTAEAAFHDLMIFLTDRIVCDVVITTPKPNHSMVRRDILNISWREQNTTAMIKDKMKQVLDISGLPCHEGQLIRIDGDSAPFVNSFCTAFVSLLKVIAVCNQRDQIVSAYLSHQNSLESQMSLDPEPAAGPTAGLASPDPDISDALYEKLLARIIGDVNGTNEKPRKRLGTTPMRNREAHIKPERNAPTDEPDSGQRVLNAAGGKAIYIAQQPVAFRGGSGSSTRSAKDFIKSISQYAKKADVDKVDALREFIADDARTWLRYQELNGVHTWKELKQAFLLEYCGRISSDKVAEFYSATPYAKEADYNFIRRMVLLADGANLNIRDKGILKYCINKLPQHTRADCLGKLHTFRSLCDLAECLSYSRSENSVIDLISDGNQNEDLRDVTTTSRRTRSQTRGLKGSGRVSSVRPFGSNLDGNVSEEGSTSEDEASIFVFKGTRGPPHCEHRNHDAADCYKQQLCSLCQNYGHKKEHCRIYCHLCKRVHPRGEVCSIVEFMKKNMHILPKELTGDLNSQTQE